MKTVELQGTVRSGIGRLAVKKVRAQKQIPAVVYGHKKKPISITVDQKEFEHVIHSAGGNALIDLKIKGEKAATEKVLIKEVQHDPIHDSVIHIDFNIVSLTEKIKIKVRLAIKGEAPGAKAGGVVDVVHHEIEVECLPTQIPEKLEADISKLEIGHAIHAKEIVFPNGVHCLLSPDEVVVAVHAVKIEEEKPAEEGAKEPEVIGKAKEEGEEGEAAPAAEAKKEAKPEAKKEAKKE